MDIKEPPRLIEGGLEAVADGYAPGKYTNMARVVALTILAGGALYVGYAPREEMPAPRYDGQRLERQP